MTGIMLSKKRHTKMNKIYKLLLLLLFSRFITSTAEWLIHFDIKDGDFAGFIELMKSKDEFILQACIFIGYIVYIFLTEAVPLLYCMKKDTIEVFLKDNLSSGFITRETGDHLISDENIENFNKSHYEISAADVKELNSFSHLEPLGLKSEIWGYYKGRNNNMDYFIRKVNEEISMYLMEDVMKEILEFRDKNIKFLNPMGFFEEENFFFIYEPWRSNNLNVFFKDVDDIKKKLEVMGRLAAAISVLHENSIVHGCLTPNNIFVIDEKGSAGGERIVVSGYGLQAFKRYLSMTSDYTNKTLYSSVELLQSKNPIIINPKKESDSYSFGMILYEIVTKNTSIQQLSLEEIEKMMCEENTRPKIPEGIQGEIKELIRKCWSKNTEIRPSMREIENEIKQILKSL